MNAEEYYRTMFHGRISSWNLRDRHMADTLEALVRHFAGKGQQARTVVWEHNSHIGDARATEMGALGEWNVGQLVRERFRDDVVLVGFSTFDGTVTAADDWDGPAQRKRVRPALEAAASGSSTRSVSIASCCCSMSPVSSCSTSRCCSARSA